MSEAAGAGEVRGIQAARVTDWLTANVAGAKAPFRFEIIAGGHSNLTYRVTGADGEQFVLRRPPLSHVLATANDMKREYTVQRGLHGTDQHGGVARLTEAVEQGLVDPVDWKLTDWVRARSRRSARTPPTSSIPNATKARRS